MDCLIELIATVPQSYCQWWIEQQGVVSWPELVLCCYESTFEQRVFLSYWIFSKGASGALTFWSWCFQSCIQFDGSVNKSAFVTQLIQSGPWSCRRWCRWIVWGLLFTRRRQWHTTSVNCSFVLAVLAVFLVDGDVRRWYNRWRLELYFCALSIVGQMNHHAVLV